MHVSEFNNFQFLFTQRKVPKKMPLSMESYWGVERHRPLRHFKATFEALLAAGGHGCI